MQDVEIVEGDAQMRSMHLGQQKQLWVLRDQLPQSGHFNPVNTDGRHGLKTNKDEWV